MAAGSDESHKQWVGSIDLMPNENADGNVLVKADNQSWVQQENDITESVENLLQDKKLDAILCVANGWAGGNAASKEFVKNSDAMWKQSVWSSSIAAELATKYLKDGGLLTLPGASPALNGTPGMIGYGMAKAAVHHLIKSLAGDKSGMPAGAVALAILPFPFILCGTCELSAWWVGSIDLMPNENADGNVLVKADNQSWVQQENDITESVENLLQDKKLDAILCVANGWAGGNAASKEFVKNSDAMWKQSVWSSSIAAELATKYLKDGGLLTLPGASPALNGTPGMIGYGMAKAAVHHLIKSLAGDKSGMPAGAVALAILPVTLDTPMNRNRMPDADHTTWTPLQFIAEMFMKWSAGEELPASGSLIQLVTNDSKTELVIV